MGFGNPGSNLGQGSLHVNTLWKSMDLSVLPPAMGK